MAARWRICLLLSRSCLNKEGFSNVVLFASKPVHVQASKQILRDVRMSTHKILRGSAEVAKQYAADCAKWSVALVSRCNCHMC